MNGGHWTLGHGGLWLQIPAGLRGVPSSTLAGLGLHEALGEDLEQLYSAAPLGSAFDWAARSRAAQGGDADAMGGAASRRASAYQSGSACRVLPT